MTAYRYLEFVPSDYDKDPAARHPLIVFLHGAGERGRDLKIVERHGPHRYRETHPDFPFIIVAPQCPTGAFWGPRRVLKTLDSALRKLRVDTSRIYLTGLSMGGFGTFYTAMAAPDRFAALAPICGGGDPRRAEEIKHIPIWVFHGGLDEIVPIANSEAIVKALRAAGAEPRYTVYPEAHHDSWTATYENPELYAWFLQHHLPGH